MEKASIKQSFDPVILVDLEDLIITEQPMPDVPVVVKDMLRKSVKIFGIKYPLRISKDYEIIDGRTRYEIAKELEIKAVPCIVSDTEENPKEHILMYDLELARRSLSNKERTKLEIERDKRLSTIEGEMLGKYLKNIIPDLRSPVERLFKATGDISLIIKVAHLDKNEQEELVTRVVVDDNSSSEEMIRGYNNLVEETKGLTVELKSSKKELENLQKKFDMLNEEYIFLKNEADEKIARQKTEIEKRIREQLMSDAPDEIRKLLEDHTATLTEKYESEMEDTLQRLREISVALDAKKEELKQNEAELNQKEKDVEDLRESHKNKNEAISVLKTTIEGLAQPVKFINSLDTVYNDLNNIFSGIINVGVDTFEDDHIDKIKINIEKIESVFKDLKELFGVPLCSCQKEK